MRRSSALRLQRDNGTTCVASNLDDSKTELITRSRPKRKLKPTTRFEDQDIPLSRPAAQIGGQSKSVLCHCPDCDKRDLSVQGIYAHYGRAHKGRLAWENVTFSCPFCMSSTRKAATQLFTPFSEIEAHVRASHPGCVAQGPRPSKIPSQPNQPQTPRQPQNDVIPKSDRVLRERKSLPEPEEDAHEEDSDTVAPQAVARKQSPPSWSKIEYFQLLPDGRKDYPRDLCRVIDMIDEQCQSQEEIMAVALEQRKKLCRSEAEGETRALNEERVSYQRGVRERARLVDGERIEKQKFTEKAEQLLIRFEYENRNKRRNAEDVEVEKLCCRPIRFSNETTRHSSRHGKVCKDEQCHFCRKENAHLHHLLLDSEISEFKLDAPATQSPLFQQSTKVLNPFFRIINDDFFSEVDTKEDFKGNGKDSTSGSKRVNQSRRDASTAKRLKTEEGKLWMLQNTKHCLKFIRKYNEGMIMNAWGDTQKDNRGRKSL